MLIIDVRYARKGVELCACTAVLIYTLCCLQVHLGRLWLCDHAFSTRPNSYPFYRNVEEVLDELDVLLAVFRERVVRHRGSDRLLPARESDVLYLDLLQDSEIRCRKTSARN